VLQCRCWGCCSLHHQVWRSSKLSGIHRCQGHIHSGRDNAREWSLGRVSSSTNQ